MTPDCAPRNPKGTGNRIQGTGEPGADVVWTEAVVPPLTFCVCFPDWQPARMRMPERRTMEDSLKVFISGIFSIFATG